MVGDNELQENSCSGGGKGHAGGDRLPHEECLDLSGRWFGTANSKRILAAVGVKGHSGGDRLPHEECLDLYGRWFGTTNSKRILAVVGARGILGETGCLMRSVWICLDVGLGQQTPREFLPWWGYGAVWGRPAAS